MESELTRREGLILNAVIEYYIIHAEPVGSRTLSKKISSNLSPATIRNIMADLEDAGLLQHPHTSAGRIPTDKGYRHYVDNLLKTYSPSKIMGTGFESLSLVHERQGLMEEISKRLSSLSKYIGLILAPKITDLRMKHMDFILLGYHKVLAVFISKSTLETYLNPGNHRPSSSLRQNTPTHPTIMSTLLTYMSLLWFSPLLFF